MGVGLRGVRWGVNDFLQIELQNHYVSVMVVPLGGQRWYSRAAYLMPSSISDCIAVGDERA